MNLSFNIDNTQLSGLSNDKSTTIKSFSKDYNVEYSDKNLDSIVKENYNDNDFIIIDRNVYNLSINTFDQLLNNCFILDAIEENKNINTVLDIINILIEKKFNKKNKLVVIGGGITQDISGFISAIYKRGLNWIFIPTTLLSMTDSCIGGKVGINHISKNMLALFVSPNKILISNYFLLSLQQDDIVSGCGESLKLCIIGGLDSYNYFLQKYDEKNYIDIIKMSLSIKKIIVEYDELEKNERKVLNYGHTFGHALESVTNYYIPHGIAVLFGMYIINRLFYDDKFNNINNLILSMIDTKFFNISIDYDNFIEHVLSDKKNSGVNICFILMENYGKMIFIYRTRDEIEEKLKNILNNLFMNKSFNA